MSKLAAAAVSSRHIQATGGFALAAAIFAAWIVLALMR